MLGLSTIGQFAIGQIIAVSIVFPQVVMMRVSDGGNDPSTRPAQWATIKPDGSHLSIAGSTSQGWAESIRYARDNGFDFQSFGSGVKSNGQNSGIISCVASQSLPPGQGIKWETHATLNFGGSDTLPAITFDSLMAANVTLEDQVVADWYYPAVIMLKPTSELPQDPAGPCITSSYIEFPSTIPVTSPFTGIPTAACIQVDTSGGAVNDSFYDIMEPNGGAYALRVGSPGYGFTYNNVRIVCAHAQTIVVFACGEDSTNAAANSGNFIDLQSHPGNGAIGIDMWGVGNIIRYASNRQEGTPSIDLKFEPTAERNIIIAAELGATTPISDLATKKSNVVITPLEYARAHRNGSDQSGVASSTWTKIAFTTEDEDTLDSFASGTFTALYGGLYFVDTTVAWVSLPAGCLMATAIYKNGTIYADNYRYTPINGMGDGVPISDHIRMAHGDTIDIYARQDSGSTQSIKGGITRTRLSIRRVA